MIFGTIEIYLGRSVIWAVLAAMLLLTGLLGFSELLSQLGRISETYPLSKALIFAALKMPAYAYDVFPMSVLIGVLAGLGQLAAQGELTIIRVSGWSPMRVMLALAKSLVLLWLVMLSVGEWLAPWAEQTAMQMRLSSGAQHLSLAGDAGFWTKEGGRFISAKTVATADTLVGVDIYEFDDRGELTHIRQADRAWFNGQDWVLYHVRLQHLGLVMHQGVFTFDRLSWHESQLAEEVVNLPFEPVGLQLLARDKKNWSMHALSTQIETLAKNGMETQSLELALWRKVAHPITLFAMLALSVPLLLRAGRASSMGGRVLLGILIGLVFFLADRVVGDMVALAQFPAIMGAMLLPMMMLTGSLVWLTRMR